MRKRNDCTRGQSMVEFALVVPILMALVLGAIDFGRVMQAKVTSESTAKAGASWGAAHLQNATQELEPAYTLGTSSGKCGTMGGADVTYPPTCNVLARSCAEAQGLPGFSGGTPIQGFGTEKYQTCLAGTAANVCTPSASQANPLLSVTWTHNGTAFTPGSGQKPVIGDALTVSGTFCFKTFFPGPLSQLTWTSSATYTVLP